MITLRHARPRRVSLFSFQSTAVLECSGAALAVPSPRLRPASRASNRGFSDQTKANTAITIGRAYDVSVDRTLAQAPFPSVSGESRQKPGAKTLTGHVQPAPPPTPRQTSPLVPGPEPARRRLTSPGVLSRRASNAHQAQVPPGAVSIRVVGPPPPPRHRPRPKPA
jgi:hypothetical protein